ncbi:hypothetical protein K1719_025812 [Acacia pycnantha]|nr:hypothetical protein K1719_025812 [Acacia pycnantha]
MEPTLINTIGLVTSVSKLTDKMDDGETIYQFTFELMDKWGSAAFSAWVSYSKVVNKDDVVVAIFYVKMIKTGDGQTIFLSHCDLSKVVFNYCHSSVVDFHFKLTRLSAAHLTPENDFTASTSHLQDLSP